MTRIGACGSLICYLSVSRIVDGHAGGDGGGVEGPGEGQLVSGLDQQHLIGL